LTGFGDSMKTEQDGARAVDFYGNDVLTSYDNGLELDGSSGNARCFRNRFTNTYATLSYQPIFGGPAYTFRNVIVNVANEQMKFHANGTLEPSGMLVYHNTFVSSGTALSLHDDATSHHFTRICDSRSSGRPIATVSDGARRGDRARSPGAPDRLTLAPRRRPSCFGASGCTRPK
jgi:hypothetical protein